MGNKDYNKLIETYKKATLLGLTSSLLGWDQEVMMPEGATEIRSQQESVISILIHEILHNKEFGGLIKKAKKGKLSREEKINLDEIRYSYKRSKKIPRELVEESAKLHTKAMPVWREARKKSNFKLFLPYLKKIVELEGKAARYIDKRKNPYEVLFNGHERKVSIKEVSKIFNDVKKGLVPIIKDIKKRENPNDKFLNIEVTPEVNYKIAKEVSRLIGLDYNNARLDVSTHPFTTRVPDIRITTRYTEGYLFNIIGTMHETGHALYLQNLPEKWFGTPIGNDRSTFVQESQAKIWEDHVGKSREFWKFYYPKLKRYIPKLKKISLDNFYKAVNKVHPSFIRVGADEVTYPLHIILRFEIEQDLISGRLKVKDLPKEWNKRMKNYLGITPSNDSQGCLQDINWAMEGVGYFPNYLLGCILAAQLFAKANKNNKIRNEIRKGNLKPLNNWLKNNIHRYGRRYNTNELIKKATGEKLSSRYFIEYLKEKYTKLYSLDK